MKNCIDCNKVLTGHSKNSLRCKSCAARARYVAKNGKPPEIIIAQCEVCDKEFQDYASNRTKGKNFFCSQKCRAAWVGVHNSITRGGDGFKRSKSFKDKIYYRRNSNKVRTGARKYYLENRGKILERLRQKNREFKIKVVEAYGGKCECCGETIVEFLTIDHINNDGALHRRKVGKGKRIYKDLLTLGCPKDNYRLLCFNCNIVRGFYGYCPHKPNEKSNISHKPFNPGRKKKVV